MLNNKALSFWCNNALYTVAHLVDIPEVNGPGSSKEMLCYRLRAELLLQCISRTLKNILKDIQRNWIKSRQSDISEQAFRQILVQFLNLVTGAHANTVGKYQNEVPRSL